MKKYVLTVFCLTLFFSSYAQEKYTIDGSEIELKTEISGTLTLLWNTVDGEFRYFIKRNTDIIELKNTRDGSKKYQEEYKTVLQNVTSQEVDLENVNLTLPSLRDFIATYNKTVDSNYTVENKKANVRSNLLVFGGVTNSPFVNNPENKSNPVFGAEIEFYETSNLPRHSIYFQLKHATSSNDFEFSSTQLGLGYRFRFIRQKTFNIYANVMLATYSFNNFETSIAEEIRSENNDGFQAPLYFGVGTDIKVGANSFITLTYDELFALLIDNQGNFSTSFAIGYKFEL